MLAIKLENKLVNGVLGKEFHWVIYMFDFKKSVIVIYFSSDKCQPILQQNKIFGHKPISVLTPTLSF